MQAIKNRIESGKIQFEMTSNGVVGLQFLQQTGGFFFALFVIFVSEMGKKSLQLQIKC